MTLQLRAEGFHVNRKRIARLMQLHGLVQRQSKADGGVAARFAQQPITSSIQKTRLTGPHQSWVTDISYARIQSSLVYASAVIDAWSAEVVGYAASLQITNRLASIALHCAVRAHRPGRGCILHSNWGAQHLEHGCCELLLLYGLIPSVREASAQTPRHIVDVRDYETWKDVTDEPREFIQTLYSRDRIDWILGRGTVDGTACSAAN
jgi:putative transposase